MSNNEHSRESSVLEEEEIPISVEPQMARDPEQLAGTQFEGPQSKLAQVRRS